MQNGKFALLAPISLFLLSFNSQAAQPAAAATTLVTNPAPAPTDDQSQVKVRSVGQIVFANGSVQASFPQQTPRMLARGSVIYEQDTITTAANSNGEIVFTDNSIVSLRPATSFIVEKYSFDQANPASGGQYVINLLKGGFRTITGFIAKSQPDNYQVKTPVATIGVRGTSYQINCENNSCATGIEMGKVSVSNSNGSVILTVDHPYATVNVAQAPIITNIMPQILAHAPIITPADAALPQNNNMKGGATNKATGNCGMVISQ